jgi:hypothetical protein
VQASPEHTPVEAGIRFACPPGKLATLASGMDGYLSELKIPSDLVVQSRGNGTLLYTLNTPPTDTITLDFHARPELRLHEDRVVLPAKNGKTRTISTVSKKEILLALLQHGRLTEFSGDACDIQSLKDHVGIRQNIVSWAENLNWIWPNGGRARWNKKYWHRGTPKPEYPLHEALNDIFLNQSRYAIGCYTASKIVMLQGVLDYFSRIKKDVTQLKPLETRLVADGEPLIDIEPGKMWSFEQDFDAGKLGRVGKLLKMQYGVAARNFVPGDWSYLVNTDPASYRKTGYEGSNAIYLGRNRFDDFYNDHQHSYTFEEKLDEIFQWRNGVFSRSRDFAKIKPISPQEIEQLARTPAEGGLLYDFRVFPYYFGYEILPGKQSH